MKNFIKLATVGMAGYVIGVYEMKYRLLKSFYMTIRKELKNDEVESN